MRRFLLGLVVAGVGPSCSKVPIYGVEAGFTQADAAWFDEEDTLFVFWDVEAEQGIADPSRIEISYATDDERVDWTAVGDFEPVHTHDPIDCGPNRLCGSMSIHVPIEPREVRVRLRYHRDGDLALDADTVFNVVGPGPPHTNRSLVVYGVFDETNQRVQWRGRHQFPTVRNMRASELGLRRDFTVRNRVYGTPTDEPFANPYAYGVQCPADFTPVGLPIAQTNARAVWDLDSLPLEASDAAVVCAQSTVTDATPAGEFTTASVARKNPEVRSAFPVLRSPIREATQLKFFLAPCNETISDEHEEMQRQRLFMEDLETYCIDDWSSPNFVPTLVVALRDAVEAERPEANDMVIVIGLHREEAGAAVAVEDALSQVVTDERHRTSPRVAGAFVFDSTTRGLQRPDLAQATLWCPSTLPLDQIPNASARSCPTLPDIPDLVVGPFSFNVLPILPSRPQYLDFIDTYSVQTAGQATELAYLTPEFATTTEHFDLGEFGVVTFLNEETIAADADDAFSYCTPEEPQPFVVRSQLMSDPAVADAIRQACELGAIPEDVCGVVTIGLLPIELLPDWHSLVPETQYQVGLFWDFPFLMRLNYTAVVAGSASAFGVSVPFGFSNPAEQFFGSQTWLAEEFRIDPALTQCRRFCDHPTFDSAGVYHVTDRFRETYARACYLPRYPQLTDPGFPLDP